MGHAGLGGVPACFAHHANAGRFASQSLACIRLLQNRAKLTPFVIDAPSFAGQKGIRVIRPKPQSIDILIFSVCLRGGPGVAIRSSCYRQKRRSRHTRQILSPAPNPFGRGRQLRDRVVTAGTLVADDGETPIGSLFVIDAEDRTTLDAFTRSDPYYVNGVWETVEIHAYRKKRGS